MARLNLLFNLLVLTSLIPLRTFGAVFFMINSMDTSISYNIVINVIKIIFYGIFAEVTKLKSSKNDKGIRISSKTRQNVDGRHGLNPETAFIRVGVKSGGCSGLEYELKFDENALEHDKIFEDSGVKIAVDKKSFLYLIGTTLDYSGGLNGKGFVFNNPNASRTCGCGESFSL